MPFHARNYLTEAPWISPTASLYYPAASSNRSRTSGSCSVAGLRTVILSWTSTRHIETRFSLPRALADGVPLSSGNGLGHSAGSASNEKEPTRDFLSGADFGEGAEGGWIEIQGERFVVSVEFLS